MPCTCAVQCTQCRRFANKLFRHPPARPYGQTPDEMTEYGRREVGYSSETAGDVDIANVQPTEEEFRKFNQEAEQAEPKASSTIRQVTTHEMTSRQKYLSFPRIDIIRRPEFLSGFIRTNPCVFYSKGNHRLPDLHFHQSPLINNVRAFRS